MTDKRNTERGLFQKFAVTRTDGKSEPGEKHENCEYFVIDLTHDKFAKPAIQAYARACEGEYSQLAADLKAKVDDDGDLPATPEWWDSVRPNGVCLVDIRTCGGKNAKKLYLACGIHTIAMNPTRRQVRSLAEACGVELREPNQSPD